jgi:hypothetical protein
VAGRGDKTAKLISTVDPFNSSMILYGSEPMIGPGGTTVGPPFVAPEAVAADPYGFLFVVDRGTQRVLRYDEFGNLKQVVNTELNTDKPPHALLDPVAVGVNDTLAYVGDRGRNQVIVYQRRK